MEQVESRVVRQSKLIVVWIYNKLYNLVPFFLCKTLLLRLAGNTIGVHTVIHTPARFLGMGRIRIGSNTIINRGCYLDNRVGIDIGNNVSIAHDTKIYSAWP